LQSFEPTNALLRGEQRNTEATANYLNHFKPTHSKNATRCESLLNRLLGKLYEVPKFIFGN
ncbi:hypothetical protein, partial [Vibrio parahaemolyticus]|uniref:hypothetical protein n=1 Tax=Vibrio parahaemolyticus TaxID=670 RepID=UPI0027E41FDB